MGQRYCVLIACIIDSFDESKRKLKDRFHNLAENYNIWKIRWCDNNF